MFLRVVVVKSVPWALLVVERVELIWEPVSGLCSVVVVKSVPWALLVVELIWEPVSELCSVVVG